MKTSKYFDKDLHQVVLSAKKNKKEKKEKKETKKKQTTKSNLLKWAVREKKDTESNNENQLEINEREVTN